MATINATLNLASSDLTSSPLSLSKTMTMNKAGSCNGLELTSGLVARKFTATTEVDLCKGGTQNYGIPTVASADGVSTNSANKIYIKNTGSSTTDYVTIGLGTATAADAIGGSHLNLGKLFGGDFLIMPAAFIATHGDITIQPSTAEETTVEYMLFFE